MAHEPKKSEERNAPRAARRVLDMVLDLTTHSLFFFSLSLSLSVLSRITYKFLLLSSVVFFFFFFFSFFSSISPSSRLSGLLLQFFQVLCLQAIRPSPIVELHFAPPRRGNKPYHFATLPIQLLGLQAVQFHASADGNGRRRRRRRRGRRSGR